MCSHERFLPFRPSAIKDTDDVHSSSTITRFTHKLHLKATQERHRNRQCCYQSLLRSYEYKHKCNFILFFTGSSTSRLRYWSSMGLPMLQLEGSARKILGKDLTWYNIKHHENKALCNHNGHFPMWFTSLAETACVQADVAGVVTSLILNMVLTISLLVYGGKKAKHGEEHAITLWQFAVTHSISHNQDVVHALLDTRRSRVPKYPFYQKYNYW